MTKEHSHNHIHVVNQEVNEKPTARTYTFSRMPAMDSGRLAMKLAASLPSLLSGGWEDNIVKTVLSDVSTVGADVVYDLAITALTSSTLVYGKSSEGTEITGQLANSVTFNQWFGEFPQDLILAFYEALRFHCFPFFLGALDQLSLNPIAKA